jgi:TPR repeat protein
MAAKSNHVPIAMVGLGRAYELGEGVPNDLKEAARWYRQASERRCHEGQLRLALALAGGLGVTRDNDEAHMWFILAAAGGFDEARVKLRVIESGMDSSRRAEAHRKAAQVDAGICKSIGL